ncbi:hypothetical protein SRS16CHR_00004 [Variovorax sp. SRS16]|uniref:hypothetical protein n=1 Tax=Variovorax sp. SRS16 TaxID=282217 RepID=UPI0013177EBD|nr:hypothetical protein [Variovorax sp. SRS16]VTU12765.1 hypothetical protein SRS16CHR_00004 [Variovorax sp. SRS16]
MNPIRFWQPVAALAFFGAMASAHALTNPPIRVAQGVEYMCGGNGSAEAAFMQTVEPRWAAALEFSVSRAKPGHVPAGVKVVVRERYSNRQVMEASADAPFMLARLEPGAYEVEATLAGVTLEQPLTVFNGQSSKAVFVWPSNIDFAAATGLPRTEQQAAARTGD